MPGDARHDPRGKPYQAAERRRGAFRDAWWSRAMSRRTTFVPYRPHTIVNKSKRPDHWFWTRYSAYPYIGCQHGCSFCYCREKKYAPYDDPGDFAHVIKVKENAPELLRKSLSRQPVDLIFTGDYQPAERKFGLSRRMLEVCLDLGFPVFVLERSPLVLRDLDLLREIHARAPSVVAFSIISTPGSPGHAAVADLEGLAPPAERRFKAMASLAANGITTGTCAMPLLPGLSDDEATLTSIVAMTADHGGSFVLVGGLTLADQQRDFFLEVLRQRHPDLETRYRSLYPAGSYGPSRDYAVKIARRVRELCARAGIQDRILRPVIPGAKRECNRRVAAWLADQAYYAELDGKPASRQWAYRKASWAIEDLPQDIRLLHQTLGKRGVANLPNVGDDIAGRIEEWMKASGSACG
jgi:DNA repair photolyase